MSALECPACEGSGRVPVIGTAPMQFVRCDQCGGSGGESIPVGEARDSDFGEYVKASQS